MKTFRYSRGLQVAFVGIVMAGSISVARADGLRQVRIHGGLHDQMLRRPVGRRIPSAVCGFRPNCTAAK